MEDNLITKENERIKSFFKAFDRMLTGLEKMVENYRPPFNGERFLTDKEIYRQLKVSRRTVQEWRYSGQIPYIQIGGKILFRESDVQAMLDRHFRKAFKPK
ncbi:MAG: helix-turn-helix domain-containing protein [Dysgonamonadaceae bacterium]|jgi:excisionase family DNA binding protein|nr:helix-turn-helix domain-containing protein [Dysgonamonadaceae bacterium]